MKNIERRNVLGVNTNSCTLIVRFIDIVNINKHFETFVNELTYFVAFKFIHSCVVGIFFMFIVS